MFTNVKVDQRKLLHNWVSVSHRSKQAPHKPGRPTTVKVKRLEKVQMRVTKLVKIITHLSYTNRLKQLKLPTSY